MIEIPGEMTSRGSEAGTQIRVKRSWLSTTFFLEDRMFDSKFFLEDHASLSSFYFWKMHASVPDFCWRFSRVRSRCFRLIRSVKASNLLQRRCSAVPSLRKSSSSSLTRSCSSFNSSRTVWQTTNVRIQALVLVERLNRNSPPHTGANNFARQYARLRADNRAALHANVVAKTNLSADNAVIFDRDAAADAGLSGDHYAFADIAVVSDVDHVVELGAAADSRAAQSRAIDAGVRAQLYVVFDYHRADLRKLVMALLTANITKSIGSHHHAGMQDDAISNSHVVINHDVWMNHTIGFRQ